MKEDTWKCPSLNLDIETCWQTQFQKIIVFTKFTANSNSDNIGLFNNGDNSGCSYEDVSIKDLIGSSDLRIRLMLSALESNEIVEDSEDTRFEKLKDRFDRLLTDPQQSLLLLQTYSLLDIPIRVLKKSNYNIHTNNNNNNNQQQFQNDEQIISLNLKFISLLLRHNNIYKYLLDNYQQQEVVVVTEQNNNNNNNSNNNNIVMKIINEIVVHFTSNDNALIRDTAINCIITMLTLNSEIADHIIYNNDYISILNTLIHNIFESFKYPSNFVSRSAEKLLYTIIHLCKNQENTTIISEYINQFLVNDSQSQSNIDVKLSLLDLFIHLLNHHNDIEFLIKNNIVGVIHYHQSTSSVIKQQQKQQQQQQELEIESSSSQLLYNHFLSLKPLFEGIVSRLLQSKQKDLMITSIDLIGVLDSSDLFNDNSNNNNNNNNNHLFDQLNSIIAIIIDNQDNNRLIITDSIMFSLIHSTKLILIGNTDSNNNRIHIQNHNKWVDFIFKVATLQAFKQSSSLKTSTKTQREAIDCIQYFDLHYILSLYNNNNNDTNQIDHDTALTSLLDSLKSQYRVVAKQTFQTLHKLINQDQKQILSDNNFLNRLLISLSKVLMSPSADIREVALSFLFSIFKDGETLGEITLIGQWLLDHNVCSMVINKLVDSDSYVRSSSLDVINVLSSFEPAWNKLIANSNSVAAGGDRAHFHIIDDSKPKKQINDELMNHNQINLIKYTEMLKLEQEQQEQHLQQQQQQSDLLSMTDSTEVQSLTGDIDFEWNDEEFREMLSRTQEEATNFLADEEESLDIAPPTLNNLNQNYPFPYSILLFFSDEESYPRILMNDTYWEVKSSCIKLFLNILSMENGLNALLKINAITLLVDKLKNSLEDNIIKIATINCLKQVLIVFRENNNNNKEISDDLGDTDGEQQQQQQIHLLKTLDLQTFESECSKETQFTEDEEEDISIFIDLKSVGLNNKDKNKIDCY
ncbi:hypothetical protein PPL_05871 [Heterostelium album PN500]|uniref:Uncharacterized protein n=1 Tax=Heterostelium pallidum (strain ATCC 26659 / Pp 5 / PN500) TaxID=670386 RepID=D3BBK3_HETP5|nr:hypothetical protein PPL_05871 [Heterostelium album PN500]EFA81036.1 hypothetical protein PPL_05871 [Heterostelium album PN500]|eukprot:XP_020433154.1 hypothetical protein PPL_05871 [Heterostelium album PN500]